MKLPRYPVYVPSRGRVEVCLTPSFLIADKVPFVLLVEPSERDAYSKRFPDSRIEVLPWNGDDAKRRKYCKAHGIENGGLIAVRNWIKEHATASGAKRHWQLDDNILQTRRYWRGKRIPCDSGLALGFTEDFVDRYENVAIAGLTYDSINLINPRSPFYLNVHVYSCSLVLNSLPHLWRSALNDDTDICLQVLADGWCTVLMNAFLIEKAQTMTVKGGNTEIYQGDGRLKMARSLERMWPGVVETKRRFNRPQHVVKNQWRKFDNELIRCADYKVATGADEGGIKLVQVAETIRSPRIKALLKSHKRLVG
jgi:hypothetical protein